MNEIIVLREVVHHRESQPEDNQDEENDVEAKLGKPELLFKVNTTEHFSDINKMSSLIV